MNASPQIRKLSLALALFFTPALAWAEPAKVVVSIKPVLGLVLAVMGDGGDSAPPAVLMPAGTSPHTFTLLPSQAKVLQDAEVVFWIGPALETALQGPLETLGTGAERVSLLATQGLDLLYSDGAVDPHIWLSPANALVMIDRIRDVLSHKYPDNAAAYAKNAKVAKNRMRLLLRKATTMLAPIKNTPYLVQHDGFGYIARAFELNPVGYLQTRPGLKPGAKHVAAIRAVIKEKGVRCLFSEPQLTPALAQNLSRELGVRLGVLDPMGTDLSVSPTLHVRLIQSLIIGLNACLYTPAKP